MQKNTNKNPFYFVRHGETDWNRQGLYQGTSDIPLNQAGIEQAILVARLLKNEPIAHIVTSPLIRAKKTAQIIAEHLAIPMTIISELQELSLGEMEGQPVGDKTIFAHWQRGQTPKTWESAADFDRRVALGFQQGLQNPAPTLFVSHAGVFIAIRRMLGLPFEHILNCQAVYHQPTMHGDIPWVSTVIE